MSHTVGLNCGIDVKAGESFQDETSGHPAQSHAQYFPIRTNK